MLNRAPLVVLLCLAACATPPIQNGDVSVLTTEATTQAVVAPAPKKADKKSGKTQLPDPEKLKGLTPAAIQEKLGVPELLHRADHVQTSLYRGPACVLDLYFYEDKKGEGFFLKWYEARGFDGKPFDAPTCLQAVTPVAVPAKKEAKARN